MPLESVASDFVIVGIHSDAPEVFWKGTKVPGVVSIKANFADGESQVKLKVNGTADALYMQLVTAGIQVKKVN